MDTSSQAIAGTKTTRRYRTQAERRRIVEETLSAGVSVATVARSHGVNANQLFHWRKLYHAGILDQAPSAASVSEVHLLPVVVHDESGADEQDTSAQEEKSTVPPVASMAASSAAAVHIEFPGRAFVSVVGSADSAVIRAVLESLRG
ncbi:IS66-like element accessory protein TnpA (plasmid) [Telmatobacter bradus]|uniref:IS66-like element accessory protein TnpA n=1 Tax=Telmatobacter bradus TaxID=474953 RepID=UPI003B434E27